MPDYQIQKWKTFFHDRGISDYLIVQYLPYIETLVSNKVPVIFEIEHLSRLIGVDITQLRKMINSPQHFYREFSIPKRRGGHRKILAPYPSLLMCQTWIYENILKSIPIHSSAHGYVKERSILSNATIHLKQNALLKVDLKDFFPSISINWVINLFSSLGYSNNVSYYLAAICCCDECLPQGAATSPYLSNILLVNLDYRLHKLSSKYHLNYTRYADDLVFSGKYIPHNLINIISSIIADFGLNVNQAKTSLIIGNKQKIITGLSVQKNELQLPRSKKRQIKQEIYYIKKYGLISHISKLKINKLNYHQSIEGKLRFWLQVEPNNKFALESLNYIHSLQNILIN
ncbi:retron St85 family RNA-directed DNA polymerase [Pragia fontium]|uniref:retron St85 family RNA-directed DNA polymerase n=1 Tax=Pragia fontium TaxID=82985 RepID=UPI00064AF08A|nr:retron St85 family RNA-directed DNA polymerase [Pragia fontium]AKJ43527.1 DNA polymerase [Pragia fontium]